MASRRRDRGCTLRMLPDDRQVAAAALAVEQNPANAPAVMMLISSDGPTPTPWALAVQTQRYWGPGGVKLGVRFMGAEGSTLRNKILSYLNRWSEFCNAKFMESAQGEVRVTTDPNGGHWSYLGTDIRSIPPVQPTMNLALSLRSPESEFLRVVPHEAGHTLGFPHEHMRRAIIERLDVAKTVAYFRRNQGWSEQQTRQQVLTPLEERSVMGSALSDETSIMCYSLPASITKDGRPVVGGADLSATDRVEAAKLYPLAVEPPPPPASAKRRVVLEISGTVENVKIVEVS